MPSENDSVPQSLQSVRVSFLNSPVLAAMPSALVRPLAIFVHVPASTFCRTKLRMFKGTCSHEGLAVTLARVFTLLDFAVSSFQVKKKGALYITM